MEILGQAQKVEMDQQQKMASNTQKEKQPNETVKEKENLKSVPNENSVAIISESEKKVCAGKIKCSKTIFYCL